MARSGQLGPRAHPGHRRLGVVVLTCLITLSLTFFLGLLVGRQWTLSLHAKAEVEKDKRPVQVGGARLKGRELGRPPQIQEKLTFYQTLTAPLAPRPPGPASKAPDTKARVAVAENEPGVSGSSETAKSEAPTHASPGDPAKLAGGAGSGRPWTVQVAAYQSRNQAEALQRSLVASGYDAYVTTVTGQDRTVRYRVRVGSYPSRGEAQKVSERLRSERALAPLVVSW